MVLLRTPLAKFQRKIITLLKDITVDFFIFAFALNKQVVVKTESDIK